MWTKPGLARALRQQSLAHRRRNFTFTPAPLPLDLDRQAPPEAPAAKAEAYRRQIRTEVVLSD
jgi:hypothetical protein